MTIIVLRVGKSHFYQFTDVWVNGTVGHHNDAVEWDGVRGRDAGEVCFLVTE